MKNNQEQAPTKGNSAMKLQVLHDNDGNIISFSLVKDGASDGLSLVPKKNQWNKVVDMPSIKVEKMSSEEDFKRLVEEIKKFKVDTSSKMGKLIRKSTKP